MGVVITAQDTLLEQINGLIADYLAASAVALPKTVFGPSDAFDQYLEDGPFPTSDPRSASAASLMRLAKGLMDEGGSERLREVLEAYRAKYGQERASVLNVRWHYLAEQ